MDVLWFSSAHGPITARSIQAVPRLRKFQSDLKGFQISKGTIRFSPGNPLPLALVKKLVNARIAQNQI
jgi:uncharacterized protein YdhG (YjbR/CyaY superfamily)